MFISALLDLVKLFSKMFMLVFHYTNSIWFPVFPLLHQYWSCQTFWFCQSCVKWYTIVSICIFLVTSENEHIFSCVYWPFGFSLGWTACLYPLPIFLLVWSFSYLFVERPHLSTPPQSWHKPTITWLGLWSLWDRNLDRAQQGISWEDLDCWNHLEAGIIWRLLCSHV